MSEDKICNFCKKKFLSNVTLLKHQKTAKFCLSIQNKEPEFKFNCDYCNKIYTRRDALEEHMTNCKTNENKTLKRELNKGIKLIEKLKNDIIEKDKLIERLLYTEKLLEEEKRKNNKLEEDIKNLASKAIENAGNKTINNNTTNNKNRIVQNLIPLTDDYMREQKQFLTYQTVKNGIEGIAEFASNHTFKDRVFCSDVSRLNFIFKSENGEVVKDPEGVELTKKFIDINKTELIRLLEEYLNQILDKLYAEDTDEVEYKIYAKRREEIIATRLAIKKGNVAENTESYNAFKRNFLYALSGLVPR